LTRVARDLSRIRTGMCSWVTHRDVVERMTHIHSQSNGPSLQPTFECPDFVSSDHTAVTIRGNRLEYGKGGRGNSELWRAYVPVLKMSSCRDMANLPITVIVSSSQNSSFLVNYHRCLLNDDLQTCDHSCFDVNPGRQNRGLSSGPDIIGTQRSSRTTR